jgi:hypothetical protein
MGFPRTQNAIVKYAEEITLNASAVSPLANYLFSANGLYDPNISGTGHQPLGFDQWMQFYDHYYVRASHIRVRRMPDSTTNLTPSYLTVGLLDSNTTAASLSDIAHVAESGKFGAPFMNWMVPSTIAIHTYECEWPTATQNHFDSKTFFNRVENDSTLKGDIASNPADQAYFCVTQANVNGNDPSAIVVLVEIVYEVLFSEPKLLAQS